MSGPITFPTFDSIPLTEPPRILTPVEMSDLIKRLHDAKGNMIDAGVTVVDIRNMVHTQRNIERPMKVEAKVEGADKPKAKKGRTTIAGDQLDSMLG